MGSTCTKVAVIDEKAAIVETALQPTGWSSVDTAEAVRQLLVAKGYSPADYPCVATGYGRVAVPYAAKTITEISCHARGAVCLFGCEDLTVIDIGGQDTKIISVERGRVGDFAMNDKCSAGTGRFLEVMANTLALTPADLCQLASQGSGVTISSMCTVFAESEVVSLIGRGTAKENIAFAVVDSIVRKVVSQTGRIRLADKVCLTGGLCSCDYVCESLGKQLKTEVITHPLAHYAGAIGAAVLAQ